MSIQNELVAVNFLKYISSKIESVFQQFKYKTQMQIHKASGYINFFFCLYMQNHQVKYNVVFNSDWKL